MKRKCSDSSGYSSLKCIKLANERVLQNRQNILPSQVVPNPILSQSLRLGGTRPLNLNRKHRVHRENKRKIRIDRAPDIGRLIEDRYVVENVLGKGSFGFVCGCTDTMAPTLKVAIKFLKYLEDDESTLNEISILKLIADTDINDISHCIRPMDLFRDTQSNQDCMVFPMYSCNLYDFINKNHFVPFNLTESKAIIKQVFEAVNFMHSLDIIHTDLKPENIMLVDSSYEYCCRKSTKFKKLKNLNIKIIDFGMAVKGSVHNHHCQTRHYRAPEIILEQEWSYGVDMWSIGCILYELITGETIFMPKSTPEHLYMIQIFLGYISQNLVERCSKDVRRKYFHKNGTLRKNDFKTDIRPLTSLYKYHKFHGVIDLIEKLIVCNFKNRITAHDALNHSFICK